MRQLQRVIVITGIGLLFQLVINLTFLGGWIDYGAEWLAGQLNHLLPVPVAVNRMAQAVTVIPVLVLVILTCGILPTHRRILANRVGHEGGAATAERARLPDRLVRHMTRGWLKWVGVAVLVFLLWVRITGRYVWMQYYDQEGLRFFLAGLPTEHETGKPIPISGLLPWQGGEWAEYTSWSGATSEGYALWNVFLPFWMPITCVALPTMWLFWRGTKTRIRGGCCSTCGYDLTGNVSGVCPECGTTLAPTTAENATESKPPLLTAVSDVTVESNATSDVTCLTAPTRTRT